MCQGKGTTKYTLIAIYSYEKSHDLFYIVGV